MGIAAAAIFVIVTTAHAAALFFNWYSTIFWLDDILHFLGGAFLAFVFLLGVQKMPQYASFAASIPLFLILGVSFAAFVGVLWEFFEFGFDSFVAPVYNFPSAQLGLSDTLSDLLFDILGSGAVLLCYAVLYKRRKTFER